ncbi:hypothetical protein ACGFNP_51320 [Nonomuraea sp. NPDC049269]|uniref:hypothetical protein n=1 Tax=Nonomuraea sp. NPDC049269 TaxID=3364349 RepID=UPI00372310E5
MTFTFGIYPGALLGTATGAVHLAHPDHPERIEEALRQLQADAPTLLVRAYRPYAATVAPDAPPTPADPERYLANGRALDLVVTFREPTGALEGWLDFIRATVRDEGARLASLQICEEPNANLPVLDGSMPNVHQALVQGVIAAKEEARARGHDLAVGFNVVPTFNPADTFWNDLGAVADDRFHQALDYVGLDFFPDVFRPIPAEQLAAAVEAVLTGLRTADLPKAGIGGGVPIRVCEHGWPTGPERGEERQAEVIEEVIRTLDKLRGDLNITGYSLFGLRDANSAGEGLYDRFGLLRDDYTPKPAFSTYSKLIAELTH